MAPSFQGKHAVVTGGNKGIGFAICQGLLAAEFDVFMAARSIEKAKAAVEKLNSSKAHPIELDVSDDNSIDAAAKHLSEQIDSLDVLINNAGIYPDKGVNILTASRELLLQTMNVNAFGAVRVTQALLPLLTKSAAARVVNTSSGYGR